VLVLGYPKLAGPRPRPGGEETGSRATSHAAGAAGDGARTDATLATDESECAGAAGAGRAARMRTGHAASSPSPTSRSACGAHGAGGWRAAASCVYVAERAGDGERAPSVRRARRAGRSVCSRRECAGRSGRAGEVVLVLVAIGWDEVLG
jgi:hypothetical protein